MDSDTVKPLASVLPPDFDIEGHRGARGLRPENTLPAFRYDQIMRLCWRYMLPLALINVFLTGSAILLLEG